jgi:hypothetical protein
MMTQQKYVESLLRTPNHYTCTTLAEPWEGVSHEAVSDFWQRERLTPRPRWERVRARISDSDEASLRAEDSLQALIERVERPSSGHEQGRVKGIGVVHRVPSAGGEGNCWPMDDRF